VVYGESDGTVLTENVRTTDVLHIAAHKQRCQLLNTSARFSKGGKFRRVEISRVNTATTNNE
jgi:hypothetical protein